jgi:aspartate/methionine/tyrosine aminotransferase
MIAHLLFFFCSFRLAGSLLQVPKTVWNTFSELAVKYEAVNLGQGFPDWKTPQFVLDALKASTYHQYARPAGHPPLVEFIAERYSAHLDHPVNPFTQVAITVGASQALYLALQTLLKHEDDEIIMFEPFFELYLKQIKLTKAKPVFVKLLPDSDWSIDFDELEKYGFRIYIYFFLLISFGFVLFLIEKSMKKLKF